MDEFINLNEFWSYLDGKTIDASTVFQTIEKCKKYTADSMSFYCLNCHSKIEKLICPKCKVGILKQIK